VLGGDSKIEQTEDTHIGPELDTGHGSGHHQHSDSGQLRAFNGMPLEINIYLTIIMYIELS
jgi:hypothetical protein